MTRIIGGSAGGRRISTPRGSATRPTSDRVREAMFSAVESWCGSLAGLRFLDLYAGSGAVGFEAWSRGAGVVTLVEQDRKTSELISRNAREIGFPKADVRSAGVDDVLRRPPATPYDLVFLDPPYLVTDEQVADDLALLVKCEWLVPDALVIVERPSRRSTVVWPDGLTRAREKKYGETTLWYGHADHGLIAPDPTASTEE